MSTPQTSLSVLQSVASQPQTQQQSGPGPQPQSSLDVLRDVAGQAKMVDRQGNISYVDSGNIDAARQQGKMATPDSGVRMITPDGKITYALPQEVGKFLSSGHVLLDPKGNYQVTPLPGEDNIDTMKRAATIAQNLPPDVMKQAIAAEKATHTPKRLAATLAAAPAMGFLGAGAIAGAGELGAAGYSGIQALTAPSVATSTVGTGILDEAGNEIMREATTYGPSLLRAAATSPAAIAAYKFLARAAATGAGLGMAGKVLGLFKGFE